MHIEIDMRTSKALDSAIIHQASDDGWKTETRMHHPNTHTHTQNKWNRPYTVRGHPFLFFHVSFSYCVRLVDEHESYLINWSTLWYCMMSPARVFGSNSHTIKELQGKPQLLLFSLCGGYSYRPKMRNKVPLEFIVQNNVCIAIPLETWRNAQFTFNTINKY